MAVKGARDCTGVAKKNAKNVMTYRKFAAKNASNLTCLKVTNEQSVNKWQRLRERNLCAMHHATSATCQHWVEGSLEIDDAFFSCQLSITLRWGTNQEKVIAGCNQFFLCPRLRGTGLQAVALLCSLPALQKKIPRWQKWLLQLTSTIYGSIWKWYQI